MNSIIFSGLGFALVIGSFLICYLLVKRSILSIVMLTFFIFCLILIITNYFWNYIPISSIKGDHIMYHLTASEISSHLSQKFWANLIADYELVDIPSYTLPLGVLY